MAQIPPDHTVMASVSDLLALASENYVYAGLATFVSLAVGYFLVNAIFFSKPFPKSSGKSIFDFTVNSIMNDKPVSLSTFRGKKAYLVVNVASK